MLGRIISSPMLTLLCCEAGFLAGILPWAGRTRRDALRYGVTAFLAAAVTAAADGLLVDSSTSSTALQPFLCLAALAVMAAAGYGLRGMKLVYAAAWTYVLADVFCQMFYFFLASRLELGSEAAQQAAKYCILFALVTLLALVLHRLLPTKMTGVTAAPVTGRKAAFAVMVLVVYLVMSNYQFIFWVIGLEDVTTITNMIPVFRLMVGALSIALLSLQASIEHQQQTRHELEVIQQLFHQQEQQYRLSRENIDIINRKCHDLKHQIAALRTMRDDRQFEERVADVERSADIYDAVVKTGNAVLDTVLTEKSLFCEAHGINMTCMADGACLEGLDAMDLYALFGNALDNAIEAVMKLRDRAKRVIQVSAMKEREMLLIRVRNYCEEDVLLVDGLPQTTKGDTVNHGYGVKSIRQTAEKYGGNLTIVTGEHMFELRVLLPIRETG